MNREDQEGSPLRADTRTVFLVAGEVSGDAQAGYLAAALRRSDPSLVLKGVCGPRMRDAGVEGKADISDLSVMGVADVFRALPRIRRVYRSVVAELDSNSPPDLLVLVDFPEFNLRLARAAKRRGVKVLYYVSPQLWAWRRGRIRCIQRNVDAMVVLFPFEAAFYEERGVTARFFGHPLAEDVKPTRSAAATKEKYGIDPSRPLVVLLPGSREGEIARHLPLMLEAANALGDRAVFAIAQARGVDLSVVSDRLAEADRRMCVVENDTYNLLAAADAAAAVSGTVTVECALLGCPPVVVYKMSKSTYILARALVRTRYVAMPNIILDALVVPELIQGGATPEALATELRALLDDSPTRTKTVERLAEVRNALVHEGAADRAATFALGLLP